MMNAIYLCIHMLDAGYAVYTMFRLGIVFQDVAPSSKQTRKEVWLLLFIIGILFIVNFFFWIPDYYSKDFGAIVSGVVVGFRSMLTVGICFYAFRFVIPALRLKYKLLLTFSKHPYNSMQVGQLVTFAECEEMMNDFKEQFPDMQPGFFFDADFIKNIAGSYGASYVYIMNALKDGKQTLVIFPADKDGERISMQPTGVMMARMSADSADGDEKGDYAGDRAGTTPPGPKG